MLLRSLKWGPRFCFCRRCACYKAVGHRHAVRAIYAEAQVRLGCSGSCFLDLHHHWVARRRSDIQADSVAQMSVVGAIGSGAGSSIVAWGAIFG